jgi:hypothetical protein
VHPDSGGVDQCIDPAEGANAFIYQVLALRLVVLVTAHDANISWIRAAVPNRLEEISVAGGKNELRTLLGQLARELCANSAGSACDYYDIVTKLAARHSVLSLQ